MALLNALRNVLLRPNRPKFQTQIINGSDSKCDDKKNPVHCSEVIKRKKLLPKEVVSRPEPHQIIFESPEDKRQKQMAKCKVSLNRPESYSLISGVPLEVTCLRTARIYQPRKNAMQSGTRNIGHWEIDYDTKPRWENPLMGWIGSGDALSNLQLKFKTREEAVQYCQKNNMRYWVQQSKTAKKFKVRSYAINFSYNKRTRVPSK